MLRCQNTKMILTTHALVGAVIGKNLNNPWLIVALVIPLHYLMDHIRHGEYVESFNKKITIKNTFWRVTLDIIIGLGVIIGIIYFHNFNAEKIFLILLGAFFSMFPDLLTFLYWKFNFKSLEKLYQFHSWVHRYPPGAKERIWNLRNAVNDIWISIAAAIILFL